MAAVPWDEKINFSSALLLHSCLTIILKEAFNFVSFLTRVSLMFLTSRRQNKANRSVSTSLVVDAYTSILSHDMDGCQVELYFTNTGFALLAISLSASVAMNLVLEDQYLNGVVVGTFMMCFLASLFAVKAHWTIPIMALRRAGRFIWSDTPFVNFFTLIYIAIVLRGDSVLRLRDYVTFRSVAVLELVFMKAKLAASRPDVQEEMMRNLIKSERVLLTSSKAFGFEMLRLPVVDRHAVAAFQTLQRLSVMFFKTTPGFDGGSLLGAQGPCKVFIPEVGRCLSENRVKICRLSDDVIILVDCFHKDSRPAGSIWARFLQHAHGILLHRIGRVRVAFAIRLEDNAGDPVHFHSNINMVTGVKEEWANSFPEGESVGGVLDLLRIRGTGLTTIRDSPNSEPLLTAKTKVLMMESRDVGAEMNTPRAY
ncbi:Uncharacterized protein PECH_000412 [Penicillium ucsense]|uniref:Uncharacterized protein n=1 Tax=Penicillium ucsense TaxID=2839758 RepID=A0A8J8W717_9EURO|nr:Uncharacterized protein PECM_000268 [Penicillium ucsense]KAF7730609.1 Uncharacterized protein PECH_000412 [Penicillium ucsense]